MSDESKAVTAGDVYAPFTPEQVVSLNGFQACKMFHPFTCGECGTVLVACEAGWRCPVMRQTVQFWAHDFMADGSWEKAADAVEKYQDEQMRGRPDER